GASPLGAARGRESPAAGPGDRFPLGRVPAPGPEELPLGTGPGLSSARDREREKPPRAGGGGGHSAHAHCDALSVFHAQAGPAWGRGTGRGSLQSVAAPAPRSPQLGLDKRGEGAAAPCPPVAVQPAALLLGDTEEDSERLNAAFASIVEFMSRTTKECEKYYSYVPASRCQENEIKHICRYHSRHAAENLLQTLGQEARKASKDLYIEVSPGTYSVTATSEDMVKDTHVVDVNAGQSIDLTFSI
uniref:A-kinase interacting protein 1 n=1 Tax=Chelydra serpentina TaxID=8475 RepID=A0A8C3SLL6_CHESE